MKPKTMILMVVAVGCGLVASYMTSKLLAERKGPPPEEKVPVVVSKTKVPKNTPLKEPEKYFEVKWRLKSDAPATYYSSLADIKDKKVNKDLKADVHISAEDLLDKNVGLPIPDGYGAIGLKINAVSAAGFFVLPGDRVDLILTQRGGDTPTSSTILREVLVLAVGNQVSSSNADGQQSATIQAATVNVAVKSDEAQLIRLAETAGELSLLLRKEGDKTETSSNKVTTRDDLKRAARAISLALGQPVNPEDEDPSKVFGWGLEEIKKPAKVETPKTDEEPVEEEPKPLPPEHVITIEPGAGASVVVPFWKRADGTLTRTPLVTPKKEKKPAAKKPEEEKPEVKPEPAPIDD